MNISHVDGQINVFTTEVFTMTGISDLIFKSFPSDPNVSVIGISVPLLGIQCKESGIINPIEDLKEAAARIYHDAMSAIYKPIWETLVSLANILSMGALDTKLPVLNLTIADLFKRDLFDIINTIITSLYKTAKDAINNILNILGIPSPFFTEIQSPEKEIYYIVKSIMFSLWDTLLKRIKEIIELIKTGLTIYDAANMTTFSITWQQAIDAILAQILSYLALPPTIADVRTAINVFVKQVLGKADATYGEIMKIINDFKLPVFGKPFDWILPINIKVNAPNIDFTKILTDMKVWLTNFMGALLKKFIDAVLTVLQFFGLSINWIAINIPIQLCTIKKLQV